MTALVTRSARATLIATAPLVSLTVLALLPSPTRYLATPLALVLPGRFALDVIAPRRPQQSMMRELPLVLILSMAVYSVLAMVEFAAVGTLSRSTVVAGVASLGVVAICRQGISRSPMSRPTRPTLRGALPAGAVAAALTMAIAGVTLVPSVRPEPYIRMNLAGRWAVLDAPIQVAAGDDLVISVQIENFGLTGQRLEVRPSFGDGLAWTTTSLQVGPGSAETVTLHGPTPPGCGHLTIEAVLDDAEPASLSVEVRTATSATVGDCQFVET